jgi:hypothetical protein
VEDRKEESRDPRSLLESGSYMSILILYLYLIASYLFFTLPFFFAGLPTDVAHYLNCGADRVLLKPLDISAFGQAMRDLSDSIAGTSTRSS